MTFKNIFLSSLLFFLANICTAQDLGQKNAFGVFFEHECSSIPSAISQVGNISYVFGKNVNLRSDSSLNGKVLEKLDEGDELKIISYTQNYAYEIEGHGEPWIQVKTSKGNIGYVYGALVAKNYLIYDLTKNGFKELILLGNDFTNPPYGQLKVFGAGELLMTEKIDSICIDTHCETMVMMRVLVDQKLSNKEILEIGTGSNHCSSIWTSTYFDISKGKIVKIFTKTILKSSSSFFDKIVFPSDVDGIDGAITIMKCKSFREKKKWLSECSLLRSYKLVDDKFELKE